MISLHWLHAYLLKKLLIINYIIATILYKYIVTMYLSQYYSIDFPQQKAQAIIA